MVEEQHVTQYGALMDPSCSWLENLLLHEYNECYLYWSCFETETDDEVKKIWERYFDMEVGHLHKAAELLQQYEGKEWQQVLPQGEFPELLRFAPQIDYVRKVLKNTVELTAAGEDYLPVDQADPQSPFFRYQEAVNKGGPEAVPSHCIIRTYQEKNGEDYRYQTKKHPVPALADRTADNTRLGRVPGASKTDPKG